MIKVKLYSSANQERGAVVCEEVEVGCGCYYLSAIESVTGAVDIIDILHHYQGGVSFAIDIMDVISIKTM